MYESSGSPQIAMDEGVSVASLRAQAERCRHHAKFINDDMACKALEALASEYDSKAAELESRH